MTPDRSGPPAALPLLELLEALREQGLPIGVREHLTVGRLLARWPDCDTAELRSALAALLARNPRESQMVLETFDRLYDSSIARASGAGEGSSGGKAPSPPFWRRVTARWVVGAFLLLPVAIGAGVYVKGVLQRPDERIPTPTPVPTSGAVAEAPQQPRVPERETTVERLNWWKAGGLAFLGAAVGLALVYRRRTGDVARRFMQRQWTAELDALPGPATYELKIRPPEPPFRPDLLDDVASVLGRNFEHTMKGIELDVDRTLARTLRAGMAPQVVWQARALSLPVVVLEDVAADMWPWRHRVVALLDGLAARGVALERWQFDADAARLFQSTGGPSTTLRQLGRRRSEHPLLVISAGQGIREGEDRKLADWVGLLRHWRSRAWLHPVTDVRYWRSAMSEVGLYAWPMTPQGVLAAAQQLARGEARLRELRDIGVAADRPVAPLDVERLQWLLSLAPRRDPELAELLRQRFCPQVPQAALLEALAAATAPAVGGAESARDRKADEGPGVGPSAAEVHAFLASVLAESEPASGTTAHARWRLDRALQDLRSGRDDVSARARGDLAQLASGPAAAMVEDATDRAGLEPALERDILAPINRRARREAWDEAARGSRAWTRPRAPELVAAVVCGLIALAASSRVDVLTSDSTARGQEVYQSDTRPASGPPGLVLTRRPQMTVAQAPDVAELMVSTEGDESGQSVATLNLVSGRAEYSIAPESLIDRYSYYWARANRPDGLVALSNVVGIGELPSRATPTTAATATPPPPTAVPRASATRVVREPTRPPVAVGPLVSSVSPEVFTKPGYAELIIRGANFDRGVSVEIKWSGVDATTFKYVSASEIAVPVQIYADSPSGQVGFIVLNPDGQSAPGSFRIELRPPENDPTQRPIENEPNQRPPTPEPEQSQVDTNPPPTQQPEEPSPKEIEDCAASDLSGTYASYKAEKNAALRMELEQVGCTLRGTMRAYRSTRSITATFDASSSDFVGTAVETSGGSSSCSNRFDVRIGTRDRQTITIETRGVDCSTKKRIDEQTLWRRPAASRS